MTGIGTIVNVAAVLVGGALGLLLRNGLKERYQVTLMQALGIATFFIGLAGALCGLLRVDGAMLQAENSMLMILTLVIGVLIGEALRIEDRMNSLGVYLQRRFQKARPPASAVETADPATTADPAPETADPAPQTTAQTAEQNRFVEGFVSATLVICVGAMAIVGSIQDALMGDPSLLFVKSALDGVLALIFASSLGVGVLFSVLPLAVYQGGMTVLAGILKPLLNDGLILNLSFIGSIMICCIGINMLWPRKIKVANFLPALFVAPLVSWLFSLLNW